MPAGPLTRSHPEKKQERTTMACNRHDIERGGTGPVFHRATTTGARIGIAKRFLREASRLEVEARYPGVAASVRAAWRREAAGVHRSAHRLLLDAAD
ncbi:hypothetical protein AD953_10300 [Acetobacter malorum]|nr:hypothetical protein AD953_10300 [Acetobacter malorum]